MAFCMGKNQPGGERLSVLRYKRRAQAQRKRRTSCGKRGLANPVSAFGRRNIVFSKGFLSLGRYSRLTRYTDARSAPGGLERKPYCAISHRCPSCRSARPRTEPVCAGRRNTLSAITNFCCGFPFFLQSWARLAPFLASSLEWRSKGRRIFPVRQA